MACIQAGPAKLSTVQGLYDAQLNALYVTWQRTCKTTLLFGQLNWMFTGS